MSLQSKNTDISRIATFGTSTSAAAAAAAAVAATTTKNTNDSTIATIK